MFSWAKIKAWLIAAGAASLALLAAVGLAMRRSRQNGINQVLTEQQERRNELQEQYDQIDSRAPDFDDAVERMRARANRDG